MNPDSTDDTLARLLSNKEEIVPSSGFAASVMDAVREEAAAPAPIPFPWKWALPGFAICLGLIVFCLVRLVADSARTASSVAAGFSLESLLGTVSHPSIAAPLAMGIEWGVLALLVSFVAVWLSMRLTVGRE